MSNETIAIIDYGMGNLRSVQKAIEHVGGRAEIVTTPDAVRNAAKVILPGVGAFQDAIARLRETGLDDAIRDEIASGKWFMGICLGFQLLFDSSSEDGAHEGLGILKGEVRRFDFSVKGDAREHLKIPHMGWNTLDYRRSCPLFAGLGDEPSVYFVHSFHAAGCIEAEVAAWCDYGYRFPAAMCKDNVLATQFHPEKSQALGLKMVENFVKL